jgi:uncharacterized membrane protein
MRRLAPLTFFLAILLPSLATARQLPHVDELPRFRVIDLGGTEALDVTDSGFVVGRLLNGTSGAVMPAVWREDQVLQLFPGSGAAGSAYAANESLRVVGNHYVDAFNLGPGGPIALEVGGPRQTASGINELGFAAGGVELASGDVRAAIWSPTGKLKLLGTFGGAESAASDINDKKWVIGSADDAQEIPRPFLFRFGNMEKLPTLSKNLGAAPRAMNNSGQACGIAWRIPPGIAIGYPRAVMWDEQGRIVDLGGPDPFALSAAADINERGWVVGHWNQKAVVFARRDGRPVPVDLHDLIPADSGWVLGRANAVNERGVIVGRGTSPHSGSSAFALVPELPLPPTAE